MMDKALLRQIFATVSASMSIFIAGSWVGWPSATTEKFIKHRTGIDVTLSQLSWIISIMDFGNVLSPIPAGYMMDRYGRKITVAALGPLYIVSWALPVFINNIWALYLARFLGGLGKGVSYTVVPVFLGEIAGVKIRGALSSVFAIQLSSGILSEVIVGPHVSYWMLNMLSGLIPIVFFLMFIWVPESPYYLLKKGLRDEAAKSLRWYRGGSDSELQQMEENVQEDMKNKGTFRELFTNPKNVKALMIITTASFAQRAGGISSLLAYSTLTLPDPAPFGPKINYIIVFVALLTGVNFVGSALVDKIGRKPLLILSEVSLGVITFIYGLFFYLQNYMDMSKYHWVAYVCLEMFSVMFAMGIAFIPIVFLGEMFPVNVRSQCSAIISIVLAFCSFVSNEIFLIVSANYGYNVMLWTFTSINFICAYLAYKTVIETTGKTFGEIQVLLGESLKRKTIKGDLLESESGV
ncbi:facilitated trehalose transporter Tret1-like [Adelges cooleyi]|uniref:facilitated trehalose transporter Tret1-like n=1 Tax=Adelges cooleyi TaxID=133065 RepID=UPI00217F73DA|nr:facilitated trehalose transporter Tret1-like [Adelges cooleyi]